MKTKNKKEGIFVARTWGGTCVDQTKKRSPTNPLLKSQRKCRQSKKAEQRERERA